MRVVLKREVLWEHILRRNLGVNTFARQCGLGSGHLSQILAGKRHPTGPIREKLLQATGTLDAPALGFDDLFVIVDEAGDMPMDLRPNGTTSDSHFAQ